MLAYLVGCLTALGSRPSVVFFVHQLFVWCHCLWLPPVYMAISVKELLGGVKLMNNIFSSINDRSRTKRLMLNASKSHAMVVYNRCADTFTLRPMILNSSRIDFVHKVKNWGIVFSRSKTRNRSFSLHFLATRIWNHFCTFISFPVLSFCAATRHYFYYCNYLD